MNEMDALTIACDAKDERIAELEAEIAELENELAHAIESAAPRPFHIVLGVNDE